MWHYSGNPGDSDIDEVRFRAQLTDPNDERISDEEKLIIKAKALREDGFSYKKISEMLGAVSKSTVMLWLNPERREKYNESAKSCRRERYANDIEYRIETNKRNSEWYYANREQRLCAINDYDNAHSEQKKQYHVDNRDRILLRMRKYYLEHRDEINRARRECTPERRDEVNRVHREYYKIPKNKRKMLDAAHLHRSLVNGGEKIEEDQYMAILEEQNGLCFYCGKQISGRDCTIEHIQPVSKKGQHKLSNIVYICARCNSSKKDRLIENWRPELLPKIMADERLDYHINGGN